MKIKIVVHFLFLVFLSFANAEDAAQRIISLAPSATAMLDELGLGASVIGITQYCKRPAEATDAAIIGSLSTQNYELIATLKPTVVFGDVESNRPGNLDRIESLRLKVVRLGPYSVLDEIVKSFRIIAKETGTTEKAEAMIQDSMDELNTIREKIKDLPKRPAFVEIWPQPLRTVSSKGYVHDVLQTAGGENLFAGSAVAYPQVSLESVIASKPQYILILTHSLIDDSRVDEYKKYPAFKDTVVRQFDSERITQPSLLHYVEAVRIIAEFFYPGVFAEKAGGEPGPK